MNFSHLQWLRFGGYKCDILHEINVNKFKNEEGMKEEDYSNRSWEKSYENPNKKHELKM